MNSQECVVLVDEQDHPVGLKEKLSAHQEGLLHRAFSVFVFREHEGALELLLQQRQFGKYHCAGLWTNTCCSHPRDGEAVLDAAKRRLKEEMGFCVDLMSAGYFIYRATLPEGLIEHELDHVFFGWFDKAQAVAIHPEEVADYRWVSVETLVHELRAHPEQFTPWFEEALARARDHVLRQKS